MRPHGPGGPGWGQGSDGRSLGRQGAGGAWACRRGCAAPAVMNGPCTYPIPAECACVREKLREKNCVSSCESEKDRKGECASERMRKPLSGVDPSLPARAFMQTEPSSFRQCCMSTSADPAPDHGTIHPLPLVTRQQFSGATGCGTVPCRSRRRPARPSAAEPPGPIQSVDVTLPLY